jgi:nitrogen fixation/metabolism regulation signal transduction histidine kinase
VVTAIVSLVGVPLADVENLTMQRSLFVIGAITLIFALLFVIVNLLVRRLILVPVVEITEVAKAVSKGDIHRAITVDKHNDEIAELTNAFELMRRSLLTAMKRMKRSP